MSVVSVFLLAGLVALVVALVMYQSGVSHERGHLLAGSQLGLSVNDLGTGLIEGIFGMSISNLSRSGSTARLVLSPAAEISEDINHSVRLAAYAALAEGLYALESHLTVSITNEEPELVLNPFGAVFRVDGSMFSLTLANRSVVQSIVLSVSVNTTGAAVDTSPLDSGAVPVFVEIRDSLGAVVLVESVSLDLDASNDPFVVQFGDGSSFTLTVGSTGDALLISQVSGLAANITSLGLQIDAPSHALSFTSNASLSIESLVGSEVNMSRQLVVFNEE